MSRKKITRSFTYITIIDNLPGGYGGISTQSEEEVRPRSPKAKRQRVIAKTFEQHKRRLADVRLGVGKARREGGFFRGRQADTDLTTAIVELRNEKLPNGKQRTWKEVRVALRTMNPKWTHPTTEKVADGTARIRMRYYRATKA
jgi:hypothetical protein